MTAEQEKLGKHAAKHAPRRSANKGESAASFRVTLSPRVMRDLQNIEDILHGGRESAPDVEKKFRGGRSVAGTIQGIAHVYSQALKRVRETKDENLHQLLARLMSGLEDESAIILHGPKTNSPGTPAN